ncbi:hypothetical protein EON65_38955 [archaeon]|nr:MAG: hypothetical protein EON65_38955 [archaeon]
MNLVQKMRAKIAIGNDGVSGTFLSIVCPMAMYEDIKSHIQFPVDVLYISIPNNHLVVKNADIADAVLGSIQVNPLIRSIGVTDLTSVDDIDAFMLTHKHHDKLQFISLHISTLPNLYSMVVELAHSFGWNCLLTVEPSVLTQSHSLPLYTDLAEKYKVPPFVVIFKCVLQLGALMCFPVQEMEKIAATFAVDVGESSIH